MFLHSFEVYQSCLWAVLKTQDSEIGEHFWARQNGLRLKNWATGLCVQSHIQTSLLHQIELLNEEKHSPRGSIWGWITLQLCKLTEDLAFSHYYVCSVWHLWVSYPLPQLLCTELLILSSSGHFPLTAYLLFQRPSVMAVSSFSLSRAHCDF